MLQNYLSIFSIIIALGYVLLAIFRNERSIATFALCGAIAFTALLEFADIRVISNPDSLFYWKRVALIAESFLPAFWLLFSLSYARQLESKAVPYILRVLLALSCLFPIAALALPIKLFFYSPDFISERILFLGDVGFLFYIGILAFMIITLINLELTLTNASLPSLWKIKFVILGAGTLIAVLIFYYSQGLLHRTIDMQLLPLRSVAIVIAVVLISYAELFRGGGAKIYISSHLAYKSLVLFVVGLYLIGLGLMGEGMKYFGESFQSTMMIAVALVAGVGLLTIFLSEKVKRKIKIYLQKNFYQNKYDYRTQWLKFTETLSYSKSGEDLLHSILTGFCETFGMGCGGLFFYDIENDSYCCVTRHEMDPITFCFSRDEMFVRLMAERKWVLSAQEDLEKGESHHAEFMQQYVISFFVPLFVHDILDGFIVLGKPINRKETYNFEDYDLMKTLARQASSAILNLRLSDQLTQAREMEAVGKVSAFIIHDLKNLVYTISLIVDNAKDYMADPEFQQDMLESLTNTVSKMKILISRLKNLPDKQVLEKTPTDLMELTKDTASLLTGGEVEVVGQSVIASVDPDEIQKVALNLIMNGIEATEGKTPVVIEVGADSQAFIRVTDKGCGIPEEYIKNHLFTPFKSTKKKGLGIGLYQCKQIVEAHNGRIEVASEPGCGTVFTVWLPKTAER